MSSKKYPVNKLFLASGMGYVAWFVAVIILKSLLPALWEGWRNPLVFDYILGLGIGLCISTMMITYTYYSWKLNAKELMIWLESQGLKRPKWRIVQFKSHFEIYGLWLMRLIFPICALVGILVSVLALSSIFNFIFD